jgi:pimeloyl-ACP methyl ester carboxylesterase
VGRRLAEQMPDARFDVVPDASRLVWLVQPEPCAQAIIAFLTPGEAGSTGRGD